MDYNQSERQESFAYETPVNSSATSFITLADVLYILRRNWYWFVVALAVTFGVAFLYLKQTQPTYQRTASILIKTTPDGTSALSDALQSTGLPGAMGGRGDIENEEQILKTDLVLNEVINRLQLETAYLKQDGLRKRDLYRQTPILVAFKNDPGVEDLSLRAEWIGADSVRLSHFKSSLRGSFRKSMVVAYGDSVATPLGQLCVSKAALFPTFKEIGTLDVKKTNHEDVLTQYKKWYSVAPQGKSSTVIMLSMRHHNPDIAADFLNTIITVYNEFARDDKVRIAQHTESFIDERLAIISNELGAVDTDIERFKQENNIADIESEAKSYITGSAEITRMLMEVNNQLAVANFLKEYLSDPRNQNQLIPANVGLTDQNANSLISEYNTLLLKQEQLVATGSDKNPMIETLNSQIAAMRQAVMKTVDNQITVLSIQLRSISREEGKTRGSISSVPMKEKIVGSIYRDQKVKESLYLFLLNARERNALNKEGIEANTRIIQPATGRSKPIAPRKSIICVMAALLGLLIPSGILYLRMLLNNKVRGRKDLDTYTTIPFLGEIPYIRHHRSADGNKTKWSDVLLFKSKRRKFEQKRKARARNILVVSRDTRSVVSEAFMVLRTNLSFMSREGTPPQVIMLTSAIAGSGKTFASANLSASLAMLEGKKVLLIDTDLRKASLTDALRSKLSRNSAGMSGYLANNKLSKEDVIIPVQSEAPFDFIPAGAIPPNPTELLLSKRFEQLIESLRAEYDYIIIDNVPYLNMADAQISNRVCDMTLFVVREGHLPRPMLADMQRMFLEKRFRNMTLVLNASGAASGTSGYSYSYYGSYGKGYDYGGTYRKEND